MSKGRTFPAPLRLGIAPRIAWPGLQPPVLHPREMALSTVMGTAPGSAPGADGLSYIACFELKCVKCAGENESRGDDRVRNQLNKTNCPGGFLYVKEVDVLLHGWEMMDLQKKRQRNLV